MMMVVTKLFQQLLHVKQSQRYEQTGQMIKWSIFAILQDCFAGTSHTTIQMSQKFWLLQVAVTLNAGQGN